MHRALSGAVAPLTIGMVLLVAAVGGASRFDAHGRFESHGRLEQIGNAMSRLAGATNADPQDGSDGFNCLFQKK